MDKFIIPGIDTRMGDEVMCFICSDKKNQVPFFEFIRLVYYFTKPGQFFRVMGQDNAKSGKNRYQ
jgi:hypothetical protein